MLTTKNCYFVLVCPYMSNKNQKMPFSEYSFEKKSVHLSFGSKL